ncbi:CLUMA_CG004601, isoform A [Clunio marinus]|uniref:CLUMA_CG004601, isoform A n=1 Tax=Clunio marinus TaxID=568069 RepID=A0A1J1HS49_9DIPT|nr:CLUMA_CG004601, isoform A [Clunio marinus]
MGNEKQSPKVTKHFLTKCEEKKAQPFASGYFSLFFRGKITANGKLSISELQFVENENGKYLKTYKLLILMKTEKEIFKRKIAFRVFSYCSQREERRDEMDNRFFSDVYSRKIGKEEEVHDFYGKRRKVTGHQFNGILI